MPTVIIGAGLAGLRTAAELRERDPSGSIIILGDEEHSPYDRPPLSSSLLSAPEPVWLAEDLSVDWPGVADEVRLGVRATGLTLGDETLVHIDDGESLRARNVVIATGSHAHNPWPGTLTLHTLDDAVRLRAALGGVPRRVAIIGAGWIGVELAHALTAGGHTVTLLEASAEPLGEHLGEAATLLRPWLDGVDLRTHTTVTGVQEADSGGSLVHTARASGQEEVLADVVITAVGVRPATDWLQGIGIPLDSRGYIHTSPTGRVETDAGRVWAVGDVAAADHPVFGLVRGGHWFSALRDPARIAADITGTQAPAAANAPEVFSDQGEHHVEALGVLTGEETVLRGDPASGSWVLFHLRDGGLVGAVVANSPRDTSSIRRALSRPEPISITAGELADTTVQLRRLLKR